MAKTATNPKQGELANSPADGALIPQAKREQLLAIDQFRREARYEIAEATASGNDMLKSFATASAMQRLRGMLTPEIMADVMQLMNSPLGFLTDRDPTKAKSGERITTYSIEQVRDVVIVALLQGFKLTGNEFNIIAGRFYGAKEGYRQLVMTWPGLTDLVLDWGVPQSAGEKGALVAVTASWKLNGEPMQLDLCPPAEKGDKDRRIPVRVNAGQGADAILGKAERKVYARILQQLSGIGQEDIEAMNEQAEAEPELMDANDTPF